MIVTWLSEASKNCLMDSKFLPLKFTQGARLNQLCWWIHAAEDEIKHKKYSLSCLIKNGSPRIFRKNIDGFNKFGGK